MKTFITKITLSLLVAICAFTSVCRAELSKEKRAEIEKMLQLTGMAETLATQLKTQIVTNLKLVIPEASDEFWKEFEKQINVGELVEKVVPLYDKYYTLEDLKIMNAFYASATGQKVFSSLPQIREESRKIGQEWGEKIGNRAAEEARKPAKSK